MSTEEEQLENYKTSVKKVLEANAMKAPGKLRPENDIALY